MSQPELATPAIYNTTVYNTGTVETPAYSLAWAADHISSHSVTEARWDEGEGKYFFTLSDVVGEISQDSIEHISDFIK